MSSTPATNLTPGDTYTVGPDTLTVTDHPHTTTGMLGDKVLRIPVRQSDGTETADVVHPDHTVTN